MSESKWKLKEAKNIISIQFLPFHNFALEFNRAKHQLCNLLECIFKDYFKFWNYHVY